MQLTNILVKSSLQGHVYGKVQRFQHDGAVMPVHDSDVEVIVQHHLPFLGTNQKVEWSKGSTAGCTEDTGGEETAVIQPVNAEVSLELSTRR